MLSPSACYDCFVSSSNEVRNAARKSNSLARAGQSLSIMPRARLTGSLLIITLCCLPACACATPPALPTLDGPAIDAIVEQALRHWHVPGAAVGIVRDDQVIYLKGYGVRELGKPEPVSADTVFPIASCTKAFTTTALAILVDQSKLSWDDPVRKHVPYFRLADPVADSAVTLRDLVCHRTGVGGNDLLWYHAPWGRREAIRRVGLVKPRAPFRSAFLYQTTMFTVAGCAVESAAGLPWESFIQKTLLEPLGMKATTMTTAAACKNVDHASPHRRDDSDQVRVIPWYEIETPEPAGSINSTARDLCQWLRLQLADGKFQGKEIVSAKNLRETHAPQMVIRLQDNVRDMNPDTVLMSYGMGWVLQDYHGHLEVSHAGAIDGFRAQVTLMPDDHLGIVLLNNLHFTPMNLAVSNQIIDLLLGFPGRDWNGYLSAQVEKAELAKAKALRDRESRRKPGTKPSHELAAYVGLYEDPAYGQASISQDENGLLWKWHQLSGDLDHYQDDTFTLYNDFLGNPDITFSIDAAGHVAGFRITGVLEADFNRVETATTK
jgi:CubicO group peptidase (beta-lactamase class C family)